MNTDNPKNCAPFHAGSSASGVSWTAAICGAFVAASLALILVIPDAGLGLSSISPTSGAQGALVTAGGRATDALLRRDRIPEDASPAARLEVGRILAGALLNGTLPDADRTYAARAIAAQTGLSQAEAERRVDAVYAQGKGGATDAEGSAKQNVTQHKPDEGGIAMKATAMKGFVGNIESIAVKNEDFRQVIYTAKNCQLVVMALKSKEEIGAEVHEKVDQFFRVEEGAGEAVIDGVPTAISAGFAVLVPAGAHHNIINTGSVPLKLYTIYAPPNHRDGVVHHTRAEAEADDETFDGKTTE